MVWRGNIGNKVGKGNHPKFDCAWEIHESQDDSLHIFSRNTYVYVCSNENKNSQNLMVAVSLPK